MRFEGGLYGMAGFSGLGTKAGMVESLPEAKPQAGRSREDTPFQLYRAVWQP